MNRMLRVNVSDKEWLEFQTAALWTGTTLSALLGQLVRDYLNDPKRSPLVKVSKKPSRKPRSR